MLEVGSGTKFQLLPFFDIVGPFLGLTSIVMTFLVRECYGSPKKHKNLLKFVKIRVEECFDKVLYHVNSRILKWKMKNVITMLIRNLGACQKAQDTIHFLVFWSWCLFWTLGFNAFMFFAYLSTNFLFFHLQLSNASTSNSIIVDAMQKSNKKICGAKFKCAT